MKIILILYVIIAIGYISNVVKLCKCDFEPSYKAEIIRSIGIIVPPVGVVIGFISIEDVKQK